MITYDSTTSIDRTLLIHYSNIQGYYQTKKNFDSSQKLLSAYEKKIDKTNLVNYFGFDEPLCLMLGKLHDQYIAEKKAMEVNNLIPTDRYFDYFYPYKDFNHFKFYDQDGKKVNVIRFKDMEAFQKTLDGTKNHGTYTRRINHELRTFKYQIRFHDADYLIVIIGGKYAIPYDYEYDAMYKLNKDLSYELINYSK